MKYLAGCGWMWIQRIDFGWVWIQRMIDFKGLTGFCHLFVRFLSFWLGVVFFGWVWMDVGGCGWMWVGVGGCGWVLVLVTPVCRD